MALIVPAVSESGTSRGRGFFITARVENQKCECTFHEKGDWVCVRVCVHVCMHVCVCARACMSACASVCL